MSIAVTDPNVINAPTNLTAGASGSTVTLNWIDHSGNENGFQVDRGVKKKGKITWTTNVGSVGVNVTTFSETVANGTHLYRVRAFNAGAVSAYSNTAQIKVGSGGGGGGGGGNGKRPKK